MDWSDSDIDTTAERLEEEYGSEYDPEEVSLQDLEDLIVNLADFEEHDGETAEASLKKIRERWIEIRNESDEDN